MKKILLILLFLPIHLSASEISGRILTENSSPAIGANVRIENTPFGDITNKNGEFQISGLQQGNYYLLISYVGYNSRKIEFELKSDSIHIGLIVLTSQPLQTGEVVVSANKKVQAVQEVPISVSVIDSRGLMDRSITRLDDALEYIPGVEINRDNVSIRGSSGFSFGVGSRAALLLDGFPLLAGDNGDIKFDALPIFNIERVEVVKGSGSALYGSSAIGGVINVITDEPNTVADIKARAYSGIYTTPRYEQWEYTDNLHRLNGANLSYSQKIGDFGVIASGGYFQDDSWRDWDDSERWNIFSKLTYDFSDRTNFQINLNAANEDKTDWVYWNSLDSATLPPSNVNRDQRIASLKMSATSNLQHIFNNNNFINFKAGIFATEYNNTLDEENPDYRQSNANTLYTELQANSTISPNFQLTYGLTFQNNIINSITYDDRDQKIYAAYTQAELKYIPRSTITIGGRLDIEQADTIDLFYQFSPKIGYLYDLNDAINLRFSFGAGFRAPTVAERYSDLSFQGFEVLPNTELKPERSWSIETGINYEFKLFDSPFYLDAAVFNNELFDLIEPEIIGETEPVIKFDNVVRARITGAELNIKTFLFGRFGLETSLTAMEPLDLDLEETLRYRAKYLWYSRIIIPYQFLEFQADYRYKSRIETIDERLGLQVDDHEARVDVHVVDARLIFKMMPLMGYPIKFTLNAKNLFDYYYIEMVGNLAMTRQISLQIDADF